LTRLAERTRDEDSDLLLVALPSWNQMRGLRRPEEVNEQRGLLREVADRWDHVYLIDMTDIIARTDVEKVYGLKDKHFSRYGYYLTAETIYDWITFDWPRGVPASIPAPPYRPPRVSIEPACALMPALRDAFSNSDAATRVAGSRP
jgi:hypothetical protein